MSLFSVRYSFSSFHVVLLLVFAVCGVTLGVLSVLFQLFCSSICCLCSEFSDLLGFDRVMFVNFKENVCFVWRLVWARNL
jgi:hypothetical protein